MSVMNDGTALAREDDLIFLNNVETYQSWRWTPLTRGDGSTGSCFCRLDSHSRPF